jgi:GNAT superfamily N-acetyltransferase
MRRKIRAQSFFGDKPNTCAHFDQRFQASCSGIQQVGVRDNPAWLSQKNDCRSAKSKVAFLLASFRRPALVGLNNTADSECAYLDLQHAPITCARESANHALVTKTRCAGPQCDRMYRVQCTPDRRRAGCLAIGRKMKTMVVAGCQSDNETSARFESIQAANQFININSAALNVEPAPRHLGKRQYATLGGRYQVEWVPVDRSRPGFELPREERIQRRVVGSGELRFAAVDAVAMNKRRDLVLASRRSFQPGTETAEPISLDENMEKQMPPPRLVKKAELALAVDPLKSQLSGLPVDIGDVITRRSHMLFPHSSERRDRNTVGGDEYTITPIDPSSPEFHEFAQFPHVRTLNPLAPTAADVMLQLGDGSLFYRHGETRLFACYQNGQLVGRVVASVDHKLPDRDVGHFGYFEACPDKACAEKLMHAAEKWLRRKGKTRIEGPINLNMLAGYRFQTAGFDTQAFPGEPRNPKYYPDLFGDLGYREIARWKSWDISPLALLGLRTFDWLQRARRRATEARGYRLEVLRTDCLEEEIRKIHFLIHEVFADNYGFSPVDLAEHMQMQGGAMDGSAQVAGAFLYHCATREPVGFSYGFYTDRTAIFHTFGVTKAHRGTGGADLLFHQGLQEIRSQGVSRAIGALAKEGKSKYEHVGKPGRAYAIVGRDL